jgi:hypothetical protein
LGFFPRFKKKVLKSIITLCFAGRRAKKRDVPSKKDKNNRWSVDSLGTLESSTFSTNLSWLKLEHSLLENSDLASYKNEPANVSTYVINNKKNFVHKVPKR